MDIGALLVPDFQPPEAVEPGQSALHLPAVAAQLLIGLDAAPRDPWHNPVVPEHLAAEGEVIALVGVQFLWPYAGSTLGALDRLHSTEDPLQHFAVVYVGGRLDDGQRDAVAIDNDVTLAPKLAPIRRVWAGLLAPRGAGTGAESTEARDQSIRSAWPSLSSSTRCSRCQTPPCCQSRKRRQHVMPEPQPISLGRYSQGMPVFKTNRMPVRAARSSTRGRPPLGLGRSGGSNGRMTAHNSSVTRGFAMPKAYPGNGFVSRSKQCNH